MIIHKKWMKQLISTCVILSVVSLAILIHFLPSLFSTQAEEVTPSITIENIHSYPKVGGTWKVNFNIEGTADLIITAVENTTWSTDQCLNCDLLFQSIQSKNKTYSFEWHNDNLIIKNFSSSETINETSLVQSPGIHVLRFSFGDDTVYAYNDASNWWNNNWGYRKKITINNSQISKKLSNFPVFMNITDTDLLDDAQEDGGDITFISYEDNTSKYAHEIERFNKTTGELVCWVNITQISSTVNTSFWMYYGDSTCENQWDNTSVWDTDYILVHHLEETDIDNGYGDIKDSTLNNNNGTTQNMNADDVIDAVANGGYDFDGDNDYIDCNDIDSIDGLDQITVSAWIKWKTGAGKLSSESEFHRKEHVYAFGGGWEEGKAKFWIYPSDGSGEEDWINSGPSISRIDDNNWHFVVGVYDNQNISIYVDGKKENTSDVGSMNLNSNIENVTIGSHSGIGEFWNGTIDEVRISQNIRNQSWIITSYNNMKNQSTFLSFGSEESAAPTINNPFPSDGNEFVSSPPSFFEITVADPNPEKLNITWRTNHSGPWETFNKTNGTGNGVDDGTYSVTNTSWVTTYDQQYFWSVNVTDGMHWTNQTFNFTMHQYNPIINSFNLSNKTGCKLNNQTGNIDVNKEYVFSINITDKNKWNDIDFINLTCWYDQGSESSFYNQTKGGNFNLNLSYENRTGSAIFKMLWPDDESALVLDNCSEEIINETTRIINLSFILGNQTRCAISNNSWSPTMNIFDDHYSWNLNCTITDSMNNNDYYENEFGVNWYSTIIAPGLVEITGAPGMIEQAQEDFPVTFTCNSDYELVIYLESNLTQIGGSDIIELENNLRLLAVADESDDIIEDTNFSGAGETNNITLENTRAPANNKTRTINIRFELSIPFGTWGLYAARIVKRIYRR